MVDDLHLRFQANKKREIYILPDVQDFHAYRLQQVIPHRTKAIFTNLFMSLKSSLNSSKRLVLFSLIPLLVAEFRKNKGIRLKVWRIRLLLRLLFENKVLPMVVEPVET